MLINLTLNITTNAAYEIFSYLKFNETIIFSKLNKTLSRGIQNAEIYFDNETIKNTHYIGSFNLTSIKINNKLITHLSWKKVYEYFDKLKHSQNKSILFNGLVQEFLDLIKQKVFESDYVGGILKIDFGDESGIYSDTYLEEIRNHKWKNVPFHTPQQHHVLDGTGRKLLLYDKERFKITIEAEIEEVYEDKRRDKRKTKYIYANKFKGDPKILEKPIPLNKILKIPKTQKNVSKSNKDKKEHGFINFNKRGHRGIWDLTQTQYDYLKGNKK